MSPSKKKNSTKQATRRARRTLQPETLEDRRLMTATSWTPDVVFDGTDIKIDGSRFSDEAVVRLRTQGTDTPADDRIEVTVSNFLTEDSIEIPRLDVNGDELVRRVVFAGYGGDDRFRNLSDRPSRATGGAGDDLITGGWGVDHLFGGSGDDWLFGGAGDDRLFGNSGDDSLFGSSGNDFLSGGSDNDLMQGGHGDDEMRGYDGNDRMYGSFGNDLMVGGSGDDEMYGGHDHDTLLGESGHDRLFGQMGRDLLHGGSGNDRVYGGDHDDVVIGGDGADKLFGLDGDDRLYAGKVDLSSYLNGGASLKIENGLDDNDDDDLYGGEGNDTFHIGDYGFWDIDKDRIKDWEFGESIRERDTYGLFPGMTFDQSGELLISSFGHSADEE